MSGREWDVHARARGQLYIAAINNPRLVALLAEIERGRERARVQELEPAAEEWSPKDRAEPCPGQCEPASLNEYLDWLRGYVARGGGPVRRRSRPFSSSLILVARGGLVVVDSDCEYGAQARQIIVPAGTRVERTNPGHCFFNGWGHTDLFWMDGFRTNSVHCAWAYSDPEFDEFGAVAQADMADMARED